MPDDAPITIAFFIVFWFDDCYFQSLLGEKSAVEIGRNGVVRIKRTPYQL
ncbi:hypothetical protein HMPREF1991_00144 [Hoylesella loescheii DSM 19665 = JCM 12249 = ATCC 15930]|uniref:Uncharacterized protein n=1 Tax=Hoylesella loescheii DSM 19665 = JCM 12249 = ATCC 15930 TaxID=1122985 RepID=A0A069QM78_HOYLO|nr:hypothetical protein HMPREF1991_00144 [Hoylesella loescheii DSM 19665 = JCM 12249 = ATCC 15930]